jgi:hypothetical protein
MPSREDVRKLMELIKNSSDAEYVFSKLQSPEWVTPLVQEGMYSSPYEPIPEEGGMLFPAWPQSRFLARLASENQSRQNQEIIVAAALSVPDTRNVRVHEDLADVALHCDGDLGAQLVPGAIKWLKSPYQLLLPRKLADLVSHLAKSRQIEHALSLSAALLEVIEDPSQKEQETSESPFHNRLEPRSRINVLDYEQVLTKIIPALVDAAADRALLLLCDLLDRAILFSDRRGAERRPEDLSYIWRPAIEEHAQNLNLGLRGLLVTAVRDAAERVARAAPASVPALIRSVEQRGKSWDIFQRIALYLLRLFPDSAPELVRRSLVDRRLFDAAAVRHEYFLLEKQCFGRLTKDEQNTILAWIEEGPPNHAERMRLWEKFIGRGLTDKDKERSVKMWKRDHFEAVRDYLPEPLASRYAALVADVGQPEHPEFLSYTEGGAWGPHSPKDRGELRDMPPQEVVDYLLAWRPSGDPFLGTSIEGLARELTAVVSENAQEYAEAASEFTRLTEPTYIRALIEGLQHALKQKHTFVWGPVVHLCDWAVSRERDIPGRTGELFEMDPHWGWARAAAARLLGDAFLSDENKLPFEFRELVWQTVERVTSDPDPTVEQEKQYVRADRKEESRNRGLKVSSLDPLTHAINSVRGVAMGTVVNYALWVANAFGKLENKDALLAQGFDAMPEVRRVLDRHLEIADEPSLAIRAVYGQRLPWLQLLDRKWAEQNTMRIFPRTELEFWHAAWDTYVCYCAAFDDVFDWLNNEYVFAAEQIGTHGHEWESSQAPDYALARHLMTFYWRGKLNGHQDVLDAFYSRADGKLRGQALNFVGVSLRSSKERMPDEVVHRLRRLLEDRVEAAKRQTVGVAEELQEYGWWFASGKFDDEWSINRLLDVLRLAGRVAPDHLVVERLADLSPAMPLQCIRALWMIVETDTKGWGVMGWRDKAKEIIRTALLSGNAETREKAQELVNLLGSRGHFDFGELLKVG